MKRLRQDLLIQLKVLFPSQMRIIKRNGQIQRRTVELDNDVQIAVHICRPLTPTVGGKPRWMLTGQRKEGGLPTLICLCDKGMSELTSFHVVPGFGDLIRRNKGKVLREGHPWLAAGKRLESLSQFYEVAKEVAGGWQPQNDITVAGDVVLTGLTSTITISGKAIIFLALRQQFSSCSSTTLDALSRRRTCVAASMSQVNGSSGLTSADFEESWVGGFESAIVTVKGEGYLYRTTDHR